MTGLSTLKAKKRSKMFKDFTVLSIVFVAFFILFSSFDTLEWLIEQSHKYETFELDEFLTASVVVSFLFAIFAFRRWQDVKELSVYCEELSMIDPVTLLPNRRVISKLLEEVREGKNTQDCFPLTLVLINIRGLDCIQATFGSNIAEQAIHELVYRYSLLLEEDQLISYRNTSQCVLFCPKLDHTKAQKLCEKIHNVDLKNRQTTLKLLSVIAVSVTLVKREDISWAFERLEDLLHEKAINEGEAA